MLGLGNGRAHRVLLGAAAILGLAIAFAASVWAAPADNAIFATRARAAVLIDGDTGAILWQNNADELMPPASITTSWPTATAPTGSRSRPST